MLTAAATLLATTLAAPQLLKLANATTHPLCTPHCCLSAKDQGYFKARAVNCDAGDDAQLWSLDPASGALYNNKPTPLYLYVNFDLLLVQTKGGGPGGHGWRHNFTYNTASRTLELSDGDGPYCLYSQFGARDFYDVQGYMIKYMHVDAPHIGHCGDADSQWTFASK